MGVLLAVCVIVAVLGLLLVLLSLVPPTAGYVPNGLGAGIALLITGVVLWLLLTLVTGAA